MIILQLSYVRIRQRLLKLQSQVFTTKQLDLFILFWQDKTIIPHAFTMTINY